MDDFLKNAKLSFEFSTHKDFSVGGANS